MARLGGCIACARDQTLQVAAFVMSALSSACMLYRWSTLDKEGRKCVWGLYGWFCGLMCAGSCCGAVAWAAWMQYLVLFFADDAASFGLNAFDDTNLGCPHLNTTYHISLTECYACFGPKHHRQSQSQAFECRFHLLNSASLGSDLATADAFAQQSSAFFYLSVYPVPYALEFFCLSVAKLLVLHRMLHVAFGKGSAQSQRWFAAGRLVMGVVIAGDLTGVCSNVATAVFYKQSSNSFADISDRLHVNATQNINVTRRVNNFISSAASRDAFVHLRSAEVASSIQQFCEVCLLLLIVVAFAVIGAKCAHRMRLLQRHLNADGRGSGGGGSSSSSSSSSIITVSTQLSEDVSRVRRQIFGTIFAVFLTFVLRAIYSTMFAVANLLQNAESCDQLCGTGCNPYTNMRSWIVLNPEFQLVIILISSPITMCVTLWGMTTERALQLMAPCRRQPNDEISLNPLRT